MCTPNQADARFSIRSLTIALVQMYYTCKRLQISPKAFTAAFGEPPRYSTQQPRNGQQRASLRQCQHCVSSLFRRLAVSHLRRAFHTTTQSSSPHRHALSSTRAPHPLLSLRSCVASAPFFHPPHSPFLCTRAPHPPFSLPPSLPPSAHHASRAAPTFLLSLDVFHVLPRPRPQPHPGCSLISFSFLEASTGLRCQPPPECGGAPGAVRVCLADHCLVLRNIRQR